MRRGPSTHGKHPLAALARRTIEMYVREGSVPPTPSGPGLDDPSAAFVSIKRRGALRGCIGTLLPTRPSVAAEVIQNAVSAATRDPRFPPLSAEELDGIDVSVDVLSAPEAIDDAGALDPSRYGVIVRCGSRCGVLLPDLEGIDTVERQLEIARRKAGIGPDEPVTLQRFTVRRLG